MPPTSSLPQSLERRRAPSLPQVQEALRRFRGGTAPLATDYAYRSASPGLNRTARRTGATSTSSASATVPTSAITT